MQLSVAAGTDVGRIRAGNEDSLYADADQERGLFIVADGMGGHAAGEVASEMAVQIVARDLTDVRDLTGNQPLSRMGEALKAANRAIYERTIQEADKQGMGTTASCIMIGQGRWIIGHIGDSRVYLLRDGTLRQLTKDHSYVQEQVDAGFLTPEQARYHPYSNVITRCVGANAAVEADVLHGEIQNGDLYLVASDGLTGMVDDRRLQQLLLARRLVEAGVEIITSSLHGPLCGRTQVWDDHAVDQHIFEALRFRMGNYDQAVSALIEDIYARGLDKRVLVVVTGEFGRTPKITFDRSTGAGDASGPAGTLQPGRDHWPRAFSNIWAGGGIQTGAVIGATDKRGEDVIERPCSAGDFLATIYHHLGIDASKVTINDFNGRPTPIVDHGRPIPGLTA